LVRSQRLLKNKNRTSLFRGEAGKVRCRRLAEERDLFRARPSDGSFAPKATVRPVQGDGPFRRRAVYASTHRNRTASFRRIAAVGRNSMRPINNPGIAQSPTGGIAATQPQQQRKNQWAGKGTDLAERENTASYCGNRSGGREPCRLR